MTNAEIIQLVVSTVAIVFSAVIAVWVGEILRGRNFKKEKRLDLLRRLIIYSYELHPGSSARSNILGALNEIKFWYDKDLEIKNAWSLLFAQVTQVSTPTPPSDDKLIELLVLIAKKENLVLSRDELMRSFFNRV